MKLGRFAFKNKIFFGVVKENEVIEIDSPFLGSKPKASYLLKDLKILPPCVPSKVIAVGLNYRNHAKELGMPIPEEPIIFLKPPSAVIAHKEKIVLPPESKEVHYEGELAVVIKRPLYRPKNLKEIKDAILGYTCFNDVTARDLQRKDGQWTRSKSFNTFAPIGPFVETDLNPSNLRIQTKVNGEVKQDSFTSELIFDVYYLIDFVSHIMTLFPGDIIATGTPPGVGRLNPGDVVEVSIEGIGTLINEVIAYE
ncbi:MAG: fumarylacetoacetate hydrolase family protein [Thermodesulfobacteria bacterium]|nr:fumarylacetoacetate hydrolase family protein [Thermodesulfobacteriota bacterium]